MGIKLKCYDVSKCPKILLDNFKTKSGCWNLGTLILRYLIASSNCVFISVGFYIDFFPVIMRRKQALWMKWKPFIIYWLYNKEKIVEILLISGVTLNVFYVLFSVENWWRFTYTIFKRIASQRIFVLWWYEREYSYSPKKFKSFNMIIW